MKSKTQKKKEITKLEEKIPKAVITIFTAFAHGGEKGLTVAQIQELKCKLRSVQSEYITAKKTLLDIALRNLNYDGVDVYAMDGSIGLAIGVSKNPDDAYVISKTLYEFAKKNSALQFFGALSNGVFVDKEHFTKMAKMPSKDGLITHLARMLSFPISRFAVVFNEIAKQKQSVPTTV